MDTKEKQIYCADCLPKKDKLELSLLIGLFFSFNLMFFAPFDFYLSNASELLIQLRYVLISLIAATVILFAVVSAICIITKKKYHIIAVSFFFAAGLAMYIQSSFLSGGLGALDGAAYKPGAVKIIINLVIWVAIISVPFLIYKFNRPLFRNFLKYVSFLVLMVEAITLCVVYINISVHDESLRTVLGNNRTYICSTQNEFTYSSNKNYIIILTDEYDSFAFDDAVATEPDCVSGFGGFTYYYNTLGMYTYTESAVPHILTGKHLDEPEPYNNDLLFSTIRQNYEMNIYSSLTMFPEQIYTEYAENYIERDVALGDFVQIFQVFGRISMYRSMPEIIKPAFWIYSDDVSNFYSLSHMQGYFDDDLSFYNNLQETLDITEKDQFKFIYLFGIHEPRNINADLERVEDWSVTPEEQAIAMNKILSAYFDILRENGVYENSEIVLLADHGLKPHESGRYPLLMIKRAGETGEDITVSNAPVSYADIYPTLLYLAGYDVEDMEERTVFDIKEDEERERYFAASGEYVTGAIK